MPIFYKFILDTTDLKSLLIAITILSVALISCNEEKDVATSKSPIAGRTSQYLFSTIEVAQNLTGTWSFVQNTNTVVRPQVEYLFTVVNPVLTAVDEFGLAYDSGNGNQYFYVVQYGATPTEGANSYFVYLNSSGAITSGPGTPGSVANINCVNARCCEKCVVNNSNCVCHNTQDDCIRKAETDIRCDKVGGSTTY